MAGEEEEGAGGGRGGGVRMVGGVRGGHLTHTAVAQSRFES